MYADFPNSRQLEVGMSFLIHCLTLEEHVKNALSLTIAQQSNMKESAYTVSDNELYPPPQILKERGCQVLV